MEIEKYGPDVETAIEEALEELGISKEEADIEILQEPVKGVLGLGSKPAFVRVKKKQGETTLDLRKKGHIQESGLKKEKKPTIREDKKIQIPEREPYDGEEKKIIENIIKASGLEVEMEMFINEEKNNFYIEIDGDDANLLIGKEGKNLDALQYLISTLLGKKDDTKNVFVDVSNYSKRHANKNIQYAQKKVKQVLETGRKETLQAMKRHERKMVHDALQGIEGIKVQSEGKEPYRRITIEKL